MAGNPSMRSLYTAKIGEERLGQYLPQVNISDRDKEIVQIYLNSSITYRNIGKRYGISGERVRQIIEKFARKAHHLKWKKNNL